MSTQLIFPRYHLWDVVAKLVDDTREARDGKSVEKRFYDKLFDNFFLYMKKK